MITDVLSAVLTIFIMFCAIVVFGSFAESRYKKFVEKFDEDAKKWYDLHYGQDKDEN